MFVAAVLAGQDRMPDLPGMTDKNLKVIVEEAAGTTVLEKGHKVALAACNEAKLNLIAANQGVTNALGWLEAARHQVEDAVLDMGEWESGRKLEVDSSPRTSARSSPR